MLKKKKRPLHCTWGVVGQDGGSINATPHALYTVLPIATSSVHAWILMVSFLRIKVGKLMVWTFYRYLNEGSAVYCFWGILHKCFASLSLAAVPPISSWVHPRIRHKKCQCRKANVITPAGSNMQRLCARGHYKVHRCNWLYLLNCNFWCATSRKNWCKGSQEDATPV